MGEQILLKVKCFPQSEHIETFITPRIRKLQLLLIYPVHGAGAQHHGAAPADVCLVNVVEVPVNVLSLVIIQNPGSRNK